MKAPIVLGACRHDVPRTPLRFSGAARVFALARAAGLLIAFSGVHRASFAKMLPPSVLPGLGPGSSRLIVDGDQPPWRGVVRVQTEIGLHCSGALVAPRLVLTAAHCLFGRGTGQMVRPGSIHILVGYSRGQYVGHARATAFVTGLGLAVAPDQQRQQAVPPGADWAVLTIDQPIGTPDRLLPLARASAAGAPAMLGGYEQDRAQVIVADPACTVIGAVQDAGGHVLLRHSCAATRGASGAPLLTRVPGSNVWAIAGVASAAAVGSSGGFAVPISAMPADALEIRR